jgi:hypothetical protein
MPHVARAGAIWALGASNMTLQDLIIDRSQALSGSGGGVMADSVALFSGTGLFIQQTTSALGGGGLHAASVGVLSVSIFC